MIKDETEWKNYLPLEIWKYALLSSGILSDNFLILFQFLIICKKHVSVLFVLFKGSSFLLTVLKFHEDVSCSRATVLSTGKILFLDKLVPFCAREIFLNYSCLSSFYVFYFIGCSLFWKQTDTMTPLLFHLSYFQCHITIFWEISSVLFFLVSFYFCFLKVPWSLIFFYPFKSINSIKVFR